MAWVTRDKSAHSAGESWYNLHATKPTARCDNGNVARVWLCETSIHPQQFRRLFRGIRLRPGEGLVEIELSLRLK